MTLTVTFEVTDFHRRAIHFWQNESKEIGTATDAEVKDFVLAAYEEWLATAIAEYPQDVEENYQKKTRKE